MTIGMEKIRWWAVLLVAICAAPGHAFADISPPRLLLDNGVTISTNEADGRSFIDKKYPLGQMIDGNARTTWVFEGTKTIVPEITITLPKGVRPEKLVIINGYAKSRSLYDRNNRITAVSVAAARGGNSVVHRLGETMKKQEVMLGDAVDGSIVIRVTGLKKGSAYDDTCISELDIVAAGRSLLRANSFISEGGGEYPVYELYHRGRRVGGFPDETIDKAFFIENGGYAVFVHAAEIDRPGVTIYNVSSGTKKYVLGDLMVDGKSLKWRQGRLVGQAFDPRTSTYVPFSRRVSLP